MRPLSPPRRDGSPLDQKGRHPTGGGLGQPKSAAGASPDRTGEARGRPRARLAHPAARRIAVGPILLGAAKPAYILTPVTTVRGLVNLTAIIAVGSGVTSEFRGVGGWGVQGAWRFQGSV